MREIEEIGYAIIGIGVGMIGILSYELYKIWKEWRKNGCKVHKWKKWDNKCK